MIILGHNECLNQVCCFFPCKASSEATSRQAFLCFACEWFKWLHHCFASAKCIVLICSISALNHKGTTVVLAPDTCVWYMCWRVPIFLSQNYFSDILLMLLSLVCNRGWEACLNTKNAGCLEPCLRVSKFWYLPEHYSKQESQPHLGVNRV